MYLIKKAEKKITSVYDKEWEKAQVTDINIDNWPEFNTSSYKPKASAKILYSDYGLHVRFETDEEPLFAGRRVQNTDICEDSCVEFFFRPDENDNRYLNFEFNPFGTMYLGLRTSREDFSFPDADKHYMEVKSFVEPEVWILMFTVPFCFIDSIFKTRSKKFYGNLYKVVGDRGTKHRLTYYPISYERPDFHRPECFGEFVLE